MRFYLIALLLLLSVSQVNAQHLTRHQADSLLNRVPRFTPGITESGDCLRLAQYFIEKEGSKKPDLDSASFFINKAKTLSTVKYSAKIQGYILLEQGFLSDEKGDQRATIRFTSRAIPILKNGGDSILLGKAYYALSRCYPDYHDNALLAKRVLLVDSAIRYLVHSPDQEELAADLLMLGDLYAIQGNEYRSNEAIKKCLEIYKAIHHEKTQGAYILLSKRYAQRADYNHALNYGLLALQACKVTRDTSAELIQVKNILGKIYSNLGNKTKATLYWTEALQQSERIRDTIACYIITVNICELYLRQQPFKVLDYLKHIEQKFPHEKRFNFTSMFSALYLEAYVELGNWPAAKLYFKNCKNLVNDLRINDAGVQEELYRGLSYYLLKTRQYSQSVYYCDLWITLSLEQHSNFSHIIALHMKFQIDSTSRNYSAAIVSNTRYYAFRDSILSEKRKKELQELEVSYQTKDKDNAIIVLNQKNKLQEDEIGRAVRLRNESIGGSVFVLLIVGLILRQNRIRQKAYGIIRKQNELITIKNEEISTKNELLEGLVLEKEYLVLEIHHRVKNNLQTTMSLLNMQSESISDKKALNAIRDSQRRMYTMSLLHNRLYQSEKKGLISMNVYIGELLVYLFESFADVENVKLEKNLEDVYLGVSVALPMGLIINEAVTNCIKYAFPEQQKGTVTLNLQQSNDGLIELTVKDNGVGLAATEDKKNQASLGLRLMKGLAEQINGIFNISSDQGTKISIRLMEVSPV